MDETIKIITKGRWEETLNSQYKTMEKERKEVVRGEGGGKGGCGKRNGVGTGGGRRDKCVGTSVIFPPSASCDFQRHRVVIRRELLYIFLYGAVITVDIGLNSRWFWVLLCVLPFMYSTDGLWALQKTPSRESEFRGRRRRRGPRRRNLSGAAVGGDLDLPRKTAIDSSSSSFFPLTSFFYDSPASP